MNHFASPLRPYGSEMTPFELCRSNQAPPRSPCPSRLPRKPITSCSPTRGSTGPSPASRPPTWFRAPARKDTACFWSDRVRRGGETTSSRLTTREKQRYVSSRCPTGWFTPPLMVEKLKVKKRRRSSALALASHRVFLLPHVSVSAAPAPLANGVGSVPGAAPALPLRHGHAQSLPPLPHPAGVRSRWRRHSVQLRSGGLQPSITG